MVMEFTYSVEVHLTILIWREFNEIGNASKHLKYEGCSVHYVELLAGEFNRLPQDIIVLVAVVHSNYCRQDT